MTTVILMAVNSVIKSFYKNTLISGWAENIKWMNWLSAWVDPIRWTHILPPQLKGNRMTVGGGVGYRKKGIFIDLTYVESITERCEFPLSSRRKRQCLFHRKTIYRQSDTHIRNQVLMSSYASEDIFFKIIFQPNQILIFIQPGDLSFGIMTCILFDEGN